MRLLVLAVIGFACVGCEAPEPPSGEAATSTVEVDSDQRPVADVTCVGCEITLDSVVTIGGVAAHLGDPAFTAFAVTPTSEILAGGLVTRGEVIRFGSDGEILPGRIGGTGEGPGEQAYVNGLALRGADTLYVFDEFRRTLNRYLVSTGEALDFVRLPGGFHEVVPIEGTRLLMSGGLLGSTAVGYPLHLVDRQGIVSSFGAELPTVTSANRSQLLRYLAVGPTGLWSAKRLDYEVTLWDHSGRAQRVFEGPWEWFPDSEESGGPQPLRGPPASRITGMWESDGKLWVFILRADPAWRPGRFFTDPGTGLERPDEPTMDPFFDTWIDVWDIRSGTVLASFSDDRMLTHVPNSPYIHAFHPTPEGIPYHTFFRVSLSMSP